jgi:hypothetical protein
MKLTKRDWSFVAIIGVIIALLLMKTGGDKPHKIPSDEKHRLLVDAVKRGKSREEVEKVCGSCHNSRVVPLPKNHPPKEQCLICHSGKG